MKIFPLVSTIMCNQEDDKKDLKFDTKPWITSKIKNLMKYRDKLMRKLNKKYTLDNEYKKFRNRVVSELRTSRTNYHKQYFTEHKNNMKMLWTGIRSIINVKNARLNNISQIIKLVRLSLILEKLPSLLIITL